MKHIHVFADIYVCHVIKAPEIEMKKRRCISRNTKDGKNSECKRRDNVRRGGTGVDWQTCEEVNVNEG